MLLASFVLPAAFACCTSSQVTGSSFWPLIGGFLSVS